MQVKGGVNGDHLHLVVPIVDKLVHHQSFFHYMAMFIPMGMQILLSNCDYSVPSFYLLCTMIYILYHMIMGFQDFGGLI